LIESTVKHSEESVREKLTGHNIDVSVFGIGDANTLKEFAAEMSAGESYLLEDERGLVRAVDLVLLKITAQVEGNARYLLERERKFADGRVKVLNRLPAMKRRPNENAYRAARKLATTILTIEETSLELDHTSSHLIEETRESPSYPGLLTVYRKHIIMGSIVEKSLGNFQFC